MSTGECVHASAMRPNASGTQAEPNASMRPPLTRGRSAGRIPTPPAEDDSASLRAPDTTGWFAEWLKQDDRRRAETMAAGKARRNQRV